MPNPYLVAAIPAGVSFLGNLFSGWAQGKITEQQLALQAKQLGLSREQFEFMKQQALRQNRVQSENVRRINPMLEALLSRSQENMSMRPEMIRLSPPNINNRYQPGVGSAGNPAPPASPAMPFLRRPGSEAPDTAPSMVMPGAATRGIMPGEHTVDPRKLALRAAMGGMQYQV